MQSHDFDKGLQFNIAFALTTLGVYRFCKFIYIARKRKNSVLDVRACIVGYIALIPSHPLTEKLLYLLFYLSSQTEFLLTFIHFNTYFLPTFVSFSSVEEKTWQLHYRLCICLFDPKPTHTPLLPMLYWNLTGFILFVDLSSVHNFAWLDNQMLKLLDDTTNISYYNVNLI